MGSGMKPILVEDFLRRTGFSLNDFGTTDLRQIKSVIGLREMRQIISMQAMPMKYLCELLSRVGTLGSFEEKIYQKSEIQLRSIDPRILNIGQKFVYRGNYQAIVENFENIFQHFCVPYGFSKLTPYIILGHNQDSDLALAQYLPPIVEIHNGGQYVLLDGIHRNRLILTSGTTIECIVITDVKTPFPCSLHGWHEIKFVDQKPEKIKDRYFDLKPELFRDLKNIGIDG